MTLQSQSLPLRANEALADTFAVCRANTEALCRPLAIEDHVVQPAPFVSPPKWHLAHTSWFFDSFVLEGEAAGKTAQGQSLHYLFNSYYKTLGEHWPQAHRGALSRPTVRDILDYRDRVTGALLARLADDVLAPAQLALVELGIHHEQQHQELLLMDIKYILGTQPGSLVYDTVSVPDRTAPPTPSPQWLAFDAGLRQAGHDPSRGFAFDNESPRHRVWQDAFVLRDRLVRNGEYLEFIHDGGYTRPELWLSDGWDWVRANAVTAPLYWRGNAGAGNDGQEWSEYHLGGVRALDPALPVSHVSYYEAAAFATWAGARLPTEVELEIAAQECTAPRDQAFWTPGAAVIPVPGRAVDFLENGLLWQWCRSAYTAYPGYRPNPGALGEYNGKFMSGRQVLRGGCVATPAGHWRPTYRNFYAPADRWCFSGIRLAKDAT